MFLDGFWNKHLQVLEARLASHGKKYLAGTDSPTIADFKCFVQYSYTFPDCNSATVIPDEVQAKVQAKIDAHPKYKEWIGRMKEFQASYL